MSPDETGDGREQVARRVEHQLSIVRRRVAVVLEPDGQVPRPLDQSLGIGTDTTLSKPLREDPTPALEVTGFRRLRELSNPLRVLVEGYQREQ